MSLIEGLSNCLFRNIHGHLLVYNSCWEDPQLDRLALGLGPSDTVLAITSSECNVLDYILTEPACVYAVDVNPRQNTLLELKVAAIKSLDFQTFFWIFGKGLLPGFPTLYRSVLRRFSRKRRAGTTPAFEDTHPAEGHSCSSSHRLSAFSENLRAEGQAWQVYKA